MVSAMSVHSVPGHYLCPIGVTCCEVTIGKSHFGISLSCGKTLQKEPLIGLEMQQLHYLGCDQTADGQMYLHQETEHTH